MKAFLWLNGPVCRVLLKEDDQIIDTHEGWNNRASAELMVMSGYPEAEIEFVSDEDRISELNLEFDKF